MELLYFALACGLFAWVWVLVGQFLGRWIRTTDQALESWAARSGHRRDGAQGPLACSPVSGVVDGRRFVVGMERRRAPGFGGGGGGDGDGNVQTMPIMMFPGPFGLPASEFLYRERFGVTSVINQVGVLRRLRLDTPEFSARSHELLSKDREFLADAWAQGLGDILSGPTVPLSYRIRPDGQLEVHRVGGWMPGWDEQALDDALATGNRLCALLESMAARRHSA